MSDELDLVESPSTAACCARCAGPLPAPAGTFSIVRVSEGEMLSTCSVSCLAAIVATPAGRTQRPAAGRRN